MTIHGIPAESRFDSESVSWPTITCAFSSRSTRCGSSPNGTRAGRSTSASQRCSRGARGAVELVAELADEPDPEREAGNACDLELSRVEVPEGVVRDVRVRQRAERLARLRPGEVDRGERAGDVDDLDVEPQTAFHHSNHSKTASEPVEVVVT